MIVLEGIYSDEKNSDGSFIYPDHIRKQSEKYYMPNKESIIGTAKEQGFIVYAQIDLTKGQKENQYIYIFLKPE